MPKPSQPEKWGRNAWRSSTQASPAFADGVAALEREDFKLAEVAFAQAAYEEPRNARAIILHLYAQLRRRPSLRMTEALDQALKFGPDDPLVLRTAAKVCVLIDQSPRAISLLEKARSIDAKDPEIHAELASAYLALRKRSSCESALNEALKLDPTNSLAISTRVQFEKTFFDATTEAERNLRKAPDTPWGLVEQGQTAIAKGEIAKGFWQLREARRLNPHSPQANEAFVQALRQRFPLLERFFTVSNHAAQYRALTSFLLVFAIARLIVSALEGAASPIWVGPTMLAGAVLLSAFAMLLVLPLPIINFALRFHPLGRVTLTKVDRAENAAFIVFLAAGFCEFCLWPVFHTPLFAGIAGLNLVLGIGIALSASTVKQPLVRGLVLTTASLSWVAANAAIVLRMLNR
jgi:tetratricopeptide (TPR) repeat protein